jgi:hypothetical protein
MKSPAKYKALIQFASQRAKNHPQQCQEEQFFHSGMTETVSRELRCFQFFRAPAAPVLGEAGFCMPALAGAAPGALVQSFWTLPKRICPSPPGAGRRKTSMTPIVYF